MNPSLRAKVEALASRIEQDVTDRFVATGYTPSVHFESSIRVHIHEGQKYIRVDVGTSGKFMVEIDGERIYGIKGYGVINRKKCFGSLDTVDQWFWGEYWPRRKAGL